MFSQHHLHPRPSSPDPKVPPPLFPTPSSLTHPRLLHIAAPPRHVPLAPHTPAGPIPPPLPRPHPRLPRPRLVRMRFLRAGSRRDFAPCRRARRECGGSRVASRHPAPPHRPSRRDSARQSATPAAAHVRVTQPSRPSDSDEAVAARLRQAARPPRPRIH